MSSIDIIALCVLSLTALAFCLSSFTYFNPKPWGRWLATLQFHYETRLTELRRGMK